MVRTSARVAPNRKDFAMSNTMEKESTPRKHRGRTWLIIGMCATLALVYQTGRSAGMRSLPTDCHCENCTCGGDCSCDRTSAVPQEPSAALPANNAPQRVIETGPPPGLVPITMFLIMFTLKLCGVIAWSWWWVTAPLWGLLVLLILSDIEFDHHRFCRNNSTYQRQPAS